MPSGKAKENGSIQRSCNDTSKCIEFVASYRAYGADQRTNFCHKDEPRRYDTTTYFHREDDDLHVRLREVGYTIIRPYDETSKYKMISHGSDKGNEQNPQRHSLLGTASKSFY